MPTVIAFNGKGTALHIGKERTQLIRGITERGRGENRGRTQEKRESSVPRRLPRVCAETEQRLKARTLTFVKVLFPPELWGKDVFVHPEKRQSSETVGGIYTGSKNGNKIAVLNTTNHDIRVPKGCILGEAEERKWRSEGVRRVRESPESTDGDTPELRAHKEQILKELKIEENELLRKNPEAKAKVVDMIMRYWRVFGEPNKSTGLTDLTEFRIQLKPGATPQRAKVRPLNPHQMESLKEQMTLWLEEGVVEPSESPWASALVPAKKKGGKIRWAIDYRKLNDVTIADSFPLPNIEQNLERLSGSRIYSALDAAAAYNVIPVAEETRPLLAFITPMGLYHYVRMPFGPKNSGAVYARFIEQLLSGLRSSNVIAYLDDILVHTVDLQTHLQELEAVLQMHLQAGIKLRPSKTVLLTESADYLGFHVGCEGVKMQEEYVQRIVEWPRPNSVKELATFLGFTGYYRTFIKDYATLTHEMNSQKKQKTLVWTETMERDFQELKKAFQGKPIRSYPRYDLQSPFEVTTDYSKKAIGGVLSQVQDGQERMIACAARKCTKYEANYPSVKGELAALIFSCRKWEHILRYREFVVNTDSQALKYIKNLQTPTGIWFRWLTELQSYQFTVNHRPGRLNTNADALSRADHHPEPSEEEITEQEKEYGPQLLQAVRELDEEERMNHIQAVEESQRMRRIHAVGQDLSRQELQRAQEEDEILSEVRGWVEQGERPEKHTLRGREDDLRVYWQRFASLRIRDDILYYCDRLNSQAGEEAWRIVLPQGHTDVAYQWSHKHITAGHFGVTGTQKRAAQRFFYPGMASELKRRVRKCPSCIAKKTRIDQRQGVHRPVHSGYPGEEIFIDLVGPLPETPERMRYILTVEDGFTKLVNCYPIPNKSAPTVCRALIEKHFSVFGIPAKVKSDNGREFVNQIFSEMADRLELSHNTTPVYNPSSNLVERFHRTLNQMLRIHLEREDTDWARLLPLVQMAYNTKVNATTGVSPYYATFGREARMPIDLVVAPPRGEGRAMDLHLDETLTRFRQIYRYIRHNLQGTVRRNADTYRGKISDYQRGQLVWYLCPRQVAGKPTKLTDQWIGPYKIVKKINDVVYRISPADFRGTPIAVHEARLLPCTDEEGHKSRIPRNTRLQIEDEGDEAGEEVRPPGRDDEGYQDANVPIRVEEPEVEIQNAPWVEQRAAASPDHVVADPFENPVAGTSNNNNLQNEVVYDNLQNEESTESPDTDADIMAPDSPEVTPPMPLPRTPPRASTESTDRDEVAEDLDLGQPGQVEDQIMGDHGGDHEGEPAGQQEPSPEVGKSTRKRKERDEAESSDRSVAPRRGVQVSVPEQTPPRIKDRTSGRLYVTQPDTPPRMTDTAGARGKRQLSPEDVPGGSGTRKKGQKKGKAKPEATKQGTAKRTRSPSVTEPVAETSRELRKRKTRKSLLEKVLKGALSSDDEDMDRIGAIQKLEVLLEKGSEVPVKGTAGSACYDVWAKTQATIPAGGTVRVPIRLKLATPIGYFCLLLSRSGLASKGLFVTGGVIDSDYRNEVAVILHNSTETDFKVNKGQRIAQSLFLKTLDVDFKEVDVLPTPATEHAGFGSTGEGHLRDSAPSSH